MDQETFILWSPDLSISPQQFNREGDAQQLAERIARANRGARIYIAKVTASVHEPLPDLQWSDGRAAGDPSSLVLSKGIDTNRVPGVRATDGCNSADALTPKQQRY